MANRPLNQVIDHFRRAVLLRDGGGMTDGELLDCFITRREEAAFEALLRRHGPMVFGVCKRVLGNVQDAEDAFQATFLVLVRKATSVVPRESVGNWLYGVAYRTALAARSTIARRSAKEKQVPHMPHPEVEPETVWHDLQVLLDRELCRLPDKYRLPVVLCDLEGRSRKEVARQLELPEGTLSSRLAMARKLLAKRLARHGLLLSGGALGTVLSENAATAAVPALLLVSTSKAAMLIAAGKATATGLISVKVAALMKGVLQAMLLTKLKMTTAVLLVVGALGIGAAALPYRTQAADAAKQSKAAGQPGTAESGKDTQSQPSAKRKEVLESHMDAKLTRVVYEKALLDHQGYLVSSNCALCHNLNSNAWHYLGYKCNPSAAANVELDDVKKVISRVREKDRRIVGKAVTVGMAVREIENVLQKQRQFIRDKEMEIQALDEIAQALEEMKKKIREEKGGK